MTSPARTSRSRTVVLTIGAPVALLGAAGAIAWSWSARFPVPVATHWGLGGVDRTANSFAGLLIGWIGVAFLLSVLLGGIALLGSPPVFTRRMAAATSVGCAALLAGMLLVIAGAQLDLARAQNADLSGGWIAIVAAGSVLLGAGAAALTRADPALGRPGPVPADAMRTDLGAAERAVWTTTVRTRGTDEQAVVWIVVIVAATVVSAQPAVLALLLVPALLVLLGHWRVTIDHNGIWARGLLGVPRTGLRLEEVVRADVTAIRPLREFGGFGVRSDLGGRYGLVVRRGDAIAVERAGGGAFVATVDGAREGAALLNALAERGRVA